MVGLIYECRVNGIFFNEFFLYNRGSWGYGFEGLFKDLEGDSGIIGVI